MKPFIQDVSVTAAKAFSALHRMPYSLWLDSADAGPGQGEYSYICAFPIETIEAKDGRVTITNSSQQTKLQADPFAILQQRLAAWNQNAKIIPGLPPFQGGLAGLFGYDLARGIEKFTEPTVRLNPHMPDMAVGIYDQVLAFDHRRNKAWIITHAANESLAAKKRQMILNALNAPIVSGNAAPLEFHPQFEKADYLERIQKVINYIHAGDIFQANLSQRFEAVLPPRFDRFSHYMELRETNPAPYAAYMNLGDIVISSASPEQFLSVQDGNVMTRPIKGTRPRGEDEEQDEEIKSELIKSPKERAENIIIVDLLRNDLSKVCETKSVELEDLCALESFAGVHHLVSTITGKLSADKTPLDLLRACFPGGSITGAPKIRAMEIIAELEPMTRGPYCGSMAWVGFNGAMDSSILIRSIIYQGNKATLQVGGGITAASKSESEYEETLVKAEKIFESFKVQDSNDDKFAVRKS